MIDRSHIIQKIVAYPSLRRQYKSSYQKSNAQAHRAYEMKLRDSPGNVSALYAAIKDQYRNHKLQHVTVYRVPLKHPRPERTDIMDESNHLQDHQYEINRKNGPFTDTVFHFPSSGFLSFLFSVSQISSPRVRYKYSDSTGLVRCAFIPICNDL